MGLKVLTESCSFGGRQLFLEHKSNTLGCDMAFSLYLPASRPRKGLPLAWFLSGLTCTAENATTKAGFQRLAAEKGVAVVCPDTSPRGAYVANDDAYDLGQGAGFYLTATQAPWATHYKMDSYVTEELPALLSAEFPLDMERQAITGHSMGGHGALTLALKNQGRYKAVSAFSPIVAPSECPWGQKAFSTYLGQDKAMWANYDACALLRKHGNILPPILIDVGSADPFLESELKIPLFEAAAADTGQALTVRVQEGYDHSYYFIASFIEDHMNHLCAEL